MRKRESQVAAPIAATGGAKVAFKGLDSAILDLVQPSLQERIVMPPRKASPWLQSYSIDARFAVRKAPTQSIGS